MTSNPINPDECQLRPCKDPTGSKLSSLERLASEPFSFDFFQAVHLLESAASTQTRASDTSSTNPIGEDFAPSSEAVRFRAAASQSFPGSTIAAFVPANKVTENSETESPPQMTVSFMGLTGPSGVLPRHYTQQLIDQLREDKGMREFFDIFNHRIDTGCIIDLLFIFFVFLPDQS